MKNKNGFTLFEMLVVISIIAILSALVSLSFSAAQKKARDSRRFQDIKSIQSAAEQYYSLSSYVYPAAAGAWTATNGQSILSIFPSDPKPGNDVYTYQKDVPAAGDYCACATLENATSGNSSVTDCSAFASSGQYFCVKNQQ